MTATAPEVIGLRERKRHETREAIHRAALRLVADQDLDSVTIDDIASAANVARRTFFNYFPAKESAVIGLDPDRAQLQADLIRARPAGESPFDALANVLVDQVTVYRTDLNRWRLMRTVFAANPGLAATAWGANAATEMTLVDAVADRMGVRVRDTPYPGQLVAALTGAVRATFAHRMTYGRRVLSRDELDAILWAALNDLRAGLPEPTNG